MWVEFISKKAGLFPFAANTTFLPNLKVLLKGFFLPNGFQMVKGIPLTTDNQNHF